MTSQALSHSFYARPRCPNQPHQRELIFMTSSRKRMKATSLGSDIARIQEYLERSAEVQSSYPLLSLNPHDKHSPVSIEPSLSSGLTDRLMGKAPLRRIASYRIVASEDQTIQHFRIEKLECGHYYPAHEPWGWDDHGRLVYLGFDRIKRRRCQPCAQLQLTKKPSKSVGIDDAEELAK